MHNCINLNLNIEPLSDTTQLDFLKSHSHYRLSKQDINIELINFLLNYEIKINHVEAFYFPPYFTQAAHIDGTGSDISKMNFIYGGRNSKINWYKEKPNINNINEKTIIGTPYKKFNWDQVDLIDSHVVGFTSVMQVGIPHNLDALEEPRQCISIVLAGINSLYLPMHKSIEIFKKFIVN